MPDDLPFKDCLRLAQSDATVDPFDVTEMIGVVPDASMPTAAGPTPPPAPSATRPPGPSAAAKN